jgi:hypothetical protein
MDDLETRQRIGRARLLRRTGKTYDEIRLVVGPVRDETLAAWLRGISRPPGTHRSRGLVELRRRCRQLRADGLTYSEIHALTGASQGSLSVWLRDVRASAKSSETIRQRAEHRRLTGLRDRAERTAIARSIRRSDAVATAMGQIGSVSDRELLLIGVALYWAEGAKNKPWAVRDRVTFINSDPSIIRVFLRWLELMGVPRERCRFRLQIHRDADVLAAEKFWATVVGIPRADLMRTSLKRHQPRTVRRNTGPGYRGCLTVDVLGSAGLYRRLEGWWSAMSVVGAEPRSTLTSLLPGWSNGMTQAFGALRSGFESSPGSFKRRG